MEKKIKKVKPFWWKLLLVLGFLTVLAWVAAGQLRRDLFLKVTFYDVGQGDSVFVQSVGGARVLIDGGPGGQVLQKIGSDLPFFDRRIDLLILTHPHADHLLGLIEVLNRYDVKRVMYYPVEYQSGYLQEFLKILKDKDFKKIIARPGQTVWLDDYTTLRVLAPVGEAPTGKVSDPNNYSIITRLTYGQADFLFTGDAGTKEMNKILDNSGLSAEVLKIGHHGSKTSTNEEILKEVAPQLAIISVGRDNRYDLPDFEVLQLLDSANIRYLRTDQSGDIRLVSRGNEIEILHRHGFFTSEEPVR